MSYILPEDQIEVPKFCEENGFYTTAKRSGQMAKIRGKNTKPELLLRKALFSAGLRFRIHVKRLAGIPDIAIRKYRVAIFVDGEFWHGHNWENRKNKLKTNKGFWLPKIERNMQRDKATNQKLIAQGFSVFRFWQQDVQKNLGACVNLVLAHIAEKQSPGEFCEP